MRRPLLLVLSALALTACGGSVEDADDDPVVAEEAALTGGPDVSEADDDAEGDDGCRDGEHDGHKHHRKHWFKVLDRLDGTKDKTITIASLPSGLPERLIARLHRIDKNDDGLVTKKEAKKEAKKAWRHRQKHRGDDDD